MSIPHKSVSPPRALFNNFVCRVLGIYESWQDGPLQGVLPGWDEVSDEDLQKFHNTATDNDLYFMTHEDSIFFDAVSENPGAKYEALLELWKNRV